jgi:hypothetical protein
LRNLIRYNIIIREKSEQMRMDCPLCGHSFMKSLLTKAICENCKFSVLLGVEYCSVRKCVERLYMDYDFKLGKFSYKCDLHGYVEPLIYE